MKKHNEKTPLPIGKNGYEDASKIEIDQFLALAIGHKQDAVDTHGSKSVWVWTGSVWREFSHEDWSVISPIGKLYDSFPIEFPGGWLAAARKLNGKAVVADTPQKAIAISVITAQLRRDCRKCGSPMGPGKAMAQTFSSSPDFAGDKNSCVTMSPGGPGALIDCMKCSACGWSVTKGQHASAGV